MISPAIALLASYIIVGVPHLFKEHHLLCCFTMVYIVLAAISSCIYGRCAFEIHGFLIENPNQPSENGSTLPYWKKWQKNYSKLGRFSQYWFNGLAAFIGWVLLYYFLVIRLKLFQVTCPYLFQIPHDLKWDDVLILLVSYLGITGRLPYVLTLGKLLK